MSPYVVNWNIESCDVYIGRPSRWGCPWQIGIDGTREEILEMYEFYLYEHPKLIEMAAKELRGRTLGCPCGRPDNCHGNILARIANGWQLGLPIIF